MLKQIVLVGLISAQCQLSQAQEVLHHQTLQQLEQRVAVLRDVFTEQEVWALAAVPVPRSEGLLKTVPMFAGQQGSWPFEPLVRAGLFKQISGYQSRHPNMLVLSKGKFSPAGLCAQLNDATMIDCGNDGATLKYPLLIQADAALVIEDTTLQLDGAKGAAIINLGALVVQRSRVSEVVAGDEKRKQRAFVLNWGGSNLWLGNASVDGLGADAHLSRGLTVARSPSQPSSTPAARVSVQHSQFSDMMVGLEISDARVQLLNNTFVSTHKQVLDIRDSNALVRGNRLSDNGMQSAVRLQGGVAVLADNHILRADKAAIEVGEGSKALLKSNTLGGGSGYGVLSQKADTLILENNLIGAGGRNGVDVQNATHLALLNNKILARSEHGVNILNDPGVAEEHFAYGNRFEAIGKSLIRTRGVSRFTVGNNQFVAKGLYQDVYGGDLSPYQGELLSAGQESVVSLTLPAAEVATRQ